MVNHSSQKTLNYGHVYNQDTFYSSNTIYGSMQNYTAGIRNSNKVAPSS